MRYISFVFVASFFLVACKKDKPKEEDTTTPTSLKKGILVLCEGLFQQNNTSLSWIDLENSNVNTTLFSEKNGRLLGDTGNDMKSYGGKIYIAVNVSSTIEVLDKNTGISIKQIPMFQNGTAKQPRSFAFYENKVLVACFDGYVDIIDTASLVIEQRIKVGDNPERMAIANGKVYVTNSGGLNAPNVDSTVSVIQLNTFQELYKITVGKNPGNIIADSQGDIYVISRGNYTTVPSRMHRIDSQLDELVQSFSFDAAGFENLGDKLLISYYNYNTSVSNIALFDAVNEVVENSNFITNEHITTLYGMKYDAVNQKIYCMDAMGFTNTGYIRTFSSSGIYESSYHVGLNPNSIIVYE